MKKLLLTLILTVAVLFTLKAQINLSAGATYTNYGTDIGKATPGIKLLGIYNISGKKAAGLGASCSLPVKQIQNYGAGNYEQTSSFITGNLAGIFHIIGRSDTNFSLYFPINISLVYGNIKYKAISSGATIPENETLTGLTVNPTVGMQVRIGTPIVFGEAGFAFPAGNTSNTRTGVTGENPVPGHSILQVGVRLPLGGSSGDAKGNGSSGKGGGKRSPHNRGDDFI